MISDELAERYRATGHAMLRGAVPAETMARCAAVVRDYIAGIVRSGSGIDAAPFKSQIAEDARTSYNLADAPAEVRELVTSPELGAIAAKLLGAEAVRVLHFCGHFKPAGGERTPWHQDLSYIPLDTDNVVSLWVALRDVEADMGSLVFAEGSHREKQLDESEVARFRVVRNEPMHAGDASAHAGWVVHAALPNSSPTLREAMTICYYADGARIAAGGNQRAMRSFLQGCFAGRGPGDLAAGPMNPIVYRSAGA